MADADESLRVLDEEIVACRKGPRLVNDREALAREKRRAYLDWIYWGKPVPGFGDPRAELMLVGLAPGAHGSNRTGRPFTGDKSGGFLYKALYDAGFANRPVAVQRDDGLALIDAYITAAARWAPTDNKPLRSELAHCRPYLERELEILKPRAILALGKIGWDVYLGILKAQGFIVSRAAFPFGHGVEVDLPQVGGRLFGVYHPSQQNTSTGKVTLAMYAKVLGQVRKYLKAKK